MIGRWLVGTLAVVMVIGLGACGQSDIGLPSAGGAISPSEVDTGDLALVARVFHDCLTDAGLPAIFEQDSRGRPTLVTIDRPVKAIGVDPEGIVFFNASVTEQEMNEFFRGRDFSIPVLEVDGIDRTAAWTECFDKSGHSMVAAMEGGMKNPFDQEQLMVLYAQSSNAWAACARANGFPETQDAVIPTQLDGNQIPIALLPVSITELELRELLIKCPNFNLEQQRRNDELLGQVDLSNPSRVKVPEGVVYPPNIGFDHPGFNGRNLLIAGQEPTQPTDHTADADPTAQRLTSLRWILDKPLRDYENGWMPD